MGTKNIFISPKKKKKIIHMIGWAVLWVKKTNMHNVTQLKK